MQSGETRGTIARMTRSKRNKPTLSPRAPRSIEAVLSVRLPVDLIMKLDEQRGEVERSTWVRETLREKLMTPVEVTVEEVREIMARRGVTVEMLLKK